MRVHWTARSSPPMTRGVMIIDYCYEGGATPSDMMQDIMPKAGNAWFWAKVLSAHGGGGRLPSQGTVPG